MRSYRAKPRSNVTNVKAVVNANAASHGSVQRFGLDCGDSLNFSEGAFDT
jgi:hypothetical protein